MAASRRQEYAGKLARVIDYIQSRHLDGLVLGRRANFAWLTCGGLNHVSTAAEFGAAWLYVTARGAVCVTNNIEAPRIAAEELADLPIEVRPFPWHDPAGAERAWNTLTSGGRIAWDMRVPALPENTLSLAEDFDRLRWTLTAQEIDRYRPLARQIGEAVEEACRLARKGMAEHELGARMTGSLQRDGIRTPVILVAADDRIRQYRHPLPTSKRFENCGMAVCTGERHGLMVSVTRRFSFGALSEDLRGRHQAVCAVDAAIIGATRPGRTLAEVFQTAQQAYAAAGFPDEWQFHHQGGSTGYVGREVRATPASTVQVLENQAFAWNPSIAGTKSEDTILVAAEANEVISATGSWPTIRYPSGSGMIARPDILVL